MVNNSRDSFVNVKIWGGRLNPLISPTLILIGGKVFYGNSKMSLLIWKYIFRRIHLHQIHAQNKSQISFCHKLVRRYTSVITLYALHSFLAETSSFCHNLVRRCIFIAKYGYTLSYSPFRH